MTKAGKKIFGASTAGRDRVVTVVFANIGSQYTSSIPENRTTSPPTTIASNEQTQTEIYTDF